MSFSEKAPLHSICCLMSLPWERRTGSSFIPCACRFVCVGYLNELKWVAPCMRTQCPFSITIVDLDYENGANL